MTDNTGPVDPDRIPYIPAWSDTPSAGIPRATPAQPGNPGGGAVAGPAGGRAARRAAGESATGRKGAGPRIAVIVLILAVVAAAAWFLTRPGDEGSGFKEGACLSDLAGEVPKTVECSSQEARYLVIEWFKDTGDTGLCASVSGGNIPMQVRIDGQRGILCVGKRG